MRRGDIVTAWTEYDLTEDADYPESIEVRVDFVITHPGCAPSHSNLDGGDPGDGPEGVVEAVSIAIGDAIRATGGAKGWRHTTIWDSALPDIDAWARHPDRTATLFQQALDNAGNGF